MKRYAGLVVVLAFAAGCSTTAPTPTATPVTQRAAATGTTASEPTAFRGQVWTWDEKEGWVTLRMGAQDVRILVEDPRILPSLQLHSFTTVRGRLAPQTIETVMTPAPVGVFVPVGTPIEGTTRARVVTLDPKGVIKLESDRGVSELWITEQTTYRVGDQVVVETTIRPVEFRTDQAPTAQPSAAISTEPGVYAIVTGRILARSSDGRLTVDSPRGPIQVWVAPNEVDRFKVGDYIQVRSRIRAS